MKKTLKRLLCASLVAVLSVGTAAFSAGCGDNGSSSGGNGADYKIGVLQVDTHTALDNAREGFTEKINKWAAENGKTVKFEFQNAKGDLNNEKTMAISLVAKKCDLLLGIATSSARALASATTRTPVLFTAVTDPVAGNIVGDNITGTSDMAQIDKQIELIKKIVPDCKKIGFLYCSGEENSKKQIELAKAQCDALNIASREYMVTATNDIQTVVSAIGSDIDAVYIPTDNLLAANMLLACNILTPKGIPVIAGEEGMCEDGEALATLGIDYKKLGEQTADIAIEILSGNKKPSDIKFQYYNRKPELYINEVNAKALLLKNANLKISSDDIAALEEEYAK